MKRAIIALVAGVAVFAGVFGFAAALTVTSDNLGAGSVDGGVVACGTAHVSYTTEWDTNEFVVTDVTVDAHADCDGQSVNVSVFDGADWTQDDAAGYELDEDGDATLELANSVPAEDLVDIHVLINGTPVTP